MPKPFQVLLAPDSFKGSLSAIQFCEIATQVIQSIQPSALVISRPMSDGGEGFVDSFVFAGLAEKQSLWTANALGRKTKVAFAWQADSKTAIIEMAQASGLPQIRQEERNPLQTHTYGTGQMIQAALELGAKKIILGLGGSATNDGGAAALQALGIPVLNHKGKPIGLGGQALAQIAQIGEIPAHLLQIEWQLACDVTNPLLGEHGATHVFGPQKGVTESNFEILEKGLENWADCIQHKTGKLIKEVPGAGAAGGMAAGFIGLLNAKVTPGFDILNEQLKLDALISAEPFDYILTGEGRMDKQTRFGKLPMRIAQLGLKHGVPTIGLCGSLQCSPEELPEFKALFSIMNQPMS
ncbi:MAG: glycerate kinase, partial [Pseudomonadota bacterium]